MSSLDNIYMKMSPTLEAADLANLHHEQARPDAEKQIGREVAHELNNILTIIRGYADRMALKHGANPALRPDLQLISENVKRAESVIRHSTLPRVSPVSRAVAAQPVA
ncbi:MAG TPA: histidine kinase dimerization/phospho-acceptor domain-containing protein [Verrucomicrobiae bacterium]